MGTLEGLVVLWIRPPPVIFMFVKPLHALVKAELYLLEEDPEGV